MPDLLPHVVISSGQPISGNLASSALMQECILPPVPAGFIFGAIYVHSISRHTIVNSVLLLAAGSGAFTDCRNTRKNSCSDEHAYVMELKDDAIDRFGYRVEVYTHAANGCAALSPV